MLTSQTAACQMMQTSWF